MIVNLVPCIFSVETVDGDHDLDASVRVVFTSSRFLFTVFCLASGCLEPMPDTIENGWKSAESFVMYNNMKYYTLARYSCNKNAVLVDSSLSIIEIECRNREWRNATLPNCQIRGEERKK